MMPMPVPVVSHDQKGHVAPHSNHLDLWNVMMPLMMPSESCDTDACASGIT